MHRRVKEGYAAKIGIISESCKYLPNYLSIRKLFCCNKKIRKRLVDSFLRIILGDPFGARTQDPNIKSVVLYRLS